MTRNVLAAALATSLILVTDGHVVIAQTRAPRAVLTPSAEPSAVRPGKTAKLRLKVVLPEKIHVQSDKPRDAPFFPTALGLTPRAGVSGTSTAYPAAVDFVQEGQS